MASTFDHSAVVTEANIRSLMLEYALEQNCVVVSLSGGGGDLHVKEVGMLHLLS